MLQKTDTLVIDKDEKRISNLLALIFFSLVLVNISPVISSITGISHEIVSLGAKVFLGGGCLINAPILLRRFKLAMVILPVTMVIVYLLQMVLFIDMTDFFANTFESFATLCLPAMLYCFAVRDYDQLQRSFIKMSYVISAFTILIFVFGFGAIKSYFSADNNYAQGLGYAYLIPILFLIQDYINKKKIASLLCGVLLTLFIVAYGSRGPLLGIALFSLSYWYRSLIRKRKIVLILVITAIAVGIMVEFDQILLWLISVMLKLGIDSRSLSLLSLDLMIDSGRSSIQMPLINEIIAHPLQIRGISADWLLVGTYSHNIVIELLYEFGVIIGGSIILFFAWRVGRTAFADITKTEVNICFIFLCASITSLFVSGTLWAEQTFWIWFVLQRNIFQVSTATPKLSGSPEPDTYEACSYTASPRQ